MNVDEIPRQLQELFDRARAGLHAQITNARTVVDSLNAEKTVAQNALADLQAQCGRAKADLDAVLAHQHRASTLAGLDSEIAKARTELERLKSETAKEGKALEALTNQRKALEPHVRTLEDSARQATAERCRAQEIIEQCKKKLELAAA